VSAMDDSSEEAPRGNRLIDVVLDETGLSAPTPEVEQERRVAIFDLIEENRFALPARAGHAIPPGPYRLRLGIRERRLVFDLTTDAGEPAGEVQLSLAPLNQVVKDYFQICESYFDAVKRLPPAQIEAIDAGRRGIHDEGSRLLLERLAGKVETDIATARRLFTLICVLHFKG
jgi:uncharacterized protein (UPF0262 family)